jgi:hypothetical protein
MLPRGFGAVFLHGGTAGDHVDTWHWVGHLRKYSCASFQRRGMARPACGFLGAQIWNPECGAKLLLATAVILPMVVPRHLVHTRNEPGAASGARAYERRIAPVSKRGISRVRGSIRPALRLRAGLITASNNGQDDVIGILTPSARLQQSGNGDMTS